MSNVDKARQSGGPAFPTDAMTIQYGVTTRDYFAAKAMQAWLTGVDNPIKNKCAEFAYEMADAMMEARK